MYSARDIRNLESQLKKRTLGGYDADSVKAQLTALAQQWEQMEEARRGAEDKVRELEEKLRHYEKVELALQEALETARDTARRTEESADRKARLIVEEAELRAQRIIQEAEQERYGLRQDLSHLTNKQTEVAARLRSFLMSELEMLAQFQGEDPVGFIKLVAPDRTAEERTLPAPPAELAEPSQTASATDELPQSEAPIPVDDAPSPDEEASLIHDVDSSESAPEAEASTPESLEEPTAPVEEVIPDVPEAVHEAEAVEPATEPVAESHEAPTAETEDVGTEAIADDLPDVDLTDDERAGLDVEPSPEPTPTAEPEPKPVIPRSPWPDVDSTRPRHTIWPPVPRATQGDEEETSEEPAPQDAASDAPASAETPPAVAPSWTSPGAFSSDPDPAPPAPSESEGGWSLRSLVTGDDTSEADKDKHREAVRRIMEDMD